jgi:hypothetical protein
MVLCLAWRPQTLYDSGMRSTLVCLSFAVAFACAGCNSPDSPVLGTPDSGGPIDASHPAATQVSFVPDSTLTLAPGESRPIRVVVEPVGVHFVRFALLGQPLDAALDSDRVETDSEGNAGVLLVAPQFATTFVIRATADEGPWAEAAVSVSGSGFGSLLVTPQYVGMRSTPIWIATAATHVTCADLTSIPPDDGPIGGQPQAGDALLVEVLPAGLDLAITVRSEHSVGGCADVSRLTSGERRSVSVQARDRPIDLGVTDIKVALEMRPDGSILDPLLEEVSQEFLDGFATKGDEAISLLDAMQQMAPNSEQFASARRSFGWDKLTQTYLLASGPSLRSQIEVWIAGGLVALRAGMTLEADVLSSTDDPSHARLSPETLGGLDASAVGCASHAIGSLSEDPGDIVHIGAQIYFLPTALIGAAAEMAVRTKSADTPNSVFAQQIDCPTLASKLRKSADTMPTSCSTVSCLERLCVGAIARMWQNARGQSAANYDIGSLSFTVSARASVDGDAAVQSLSGTWAGSVARGDQTPISLKGTASASKQ